MNAKALLKVMQSKLPKPSRCIKDRAALRSRIFRNQKAAHKAAARHFRRFAESADYPPLWLEISLAPRMLHKRASFYFEGGRVIRGRATIFTPEGAA